MRGTIVRIGAAGAGVLLALGLITAPAGASDSEQHGKSDRKATAECLDTSGQTQGRSTSDPDGTSNGGTDKPGCAGDFDSDRDGNNGCGNDADREDDNNGHCGRPAQAGQTDGDDEGDEAPDASSTTTTTTDSDSVSPDVEDDSTDKEDVSDDEDSTDDEDSSDDADSNVEDDESDDDSTAGGDSTEQDSSDEQPAPVTTAGVGVGGLALLGGILRLFLRIF
jgi:hypothetical protein